MNISSQKRQGNLIVIFKYISTPYDAAKNVHF